MNEKYVLSLLVITVIKKKLNVVKLLIQYRYSSAYYKGRMNI